MSPAIRVLVVEDSAVMCRAIVRRIQEDERFQVIDTASDGRAGVQKAARLRPDVITMDVEMPGMNGIEALKLITANLGTPVVMLSAVTERGAQATMDALRFGAFDFIPKSKGAEQIHEKLLAAVEARKRGVLRPASTPQARSALPTRELKGASTTPRSTTPCFPVGFNPRVLAIGSSTGGPQALSVVLKNLPETFPLPILVAQHMPPEFTKALARQLDESCSLSVVEAAHHETAKRGTVYIGPGGRHIRIQKDGRIAISEDKGESLYKPSVDLLVDSAQDAFGRNVLAVMLTGMGNDGAAAFRRLHSAGGYTIAQNQSTSVVYGMPKAVADMNAATEIISINEIPDLLRTLFRI